MTEPDPHPSSSPVIAYRSRPPARPGMSVTGILVATAFYLLAASAFAMCLGFLVFTISNFLDFIQSDHGRGLSIVLMTIGLAVSASLSGATLMMIRVARRQR